MTQLTMLFYRFTGTRSSGTLAWLGYCLGWLLLPIAPFGDQALDPQHFNQVLGMALPGQYVLNRATVLGGCCWLWVLVSVWKGHRSDSTQQLRKWWQRTDLCIVAWILSPAVMGLFNPSSYLQDLYQTLYLAVAWGGPYALGRTALRDATDFKASARLLQVLGVGTLLLAVPEFIWGRFWYNLLYGPHPYIAEGAQRYFGFRPLLFSEDPNQIGMWWATLAICAIGVWGWIPKAKRWNAPAMRYLWLIAPVFLFQAIGASLLTIVGGVALNARVTKRIKSGLVMAAMLMIALFLLRAPVTSKLRDFANNHPTGQILKQMMTKASLQSLSWRLALEDKTADRSLRSVIVGSGEMLRWTKLKMDQRPWGMLSLTAGAWGILATLALSATLLVPFVFLVGAASGTQQLAIVKFIAVLSMVHLIDAAFNSGFLLPLLIWNGALANLLSSDDVFAYSPNQRIRVG